MSWAEHNNQRREVYSALRSLGAWVERAEWKAYDPFDGLSSPLAPVLTLNVPRLKQLLLHAVRRSPLNLRPLLRIKPATSTKAMGYLAQGYLKLFETYGEPEDLERAQLCLTWLIDHRSPGFRGYCWGNHFDGQTRGGFIKKGVPTVVWSSLIGHAFLDAYQALREPTYLDVAGGVAGFIANELGWVEDGEAICFNYIPSADGRIVKGKHGIHNANALGGGFLARFHGLVPSPGHAELARRSMEFTARDQRPNGSWHYGTEPTYHWADSFHTGYVLESLDWYARGTGDERYAEVLRRGYKFYIESFFETDGTPRYYDRKRTPLDIQCASQGIQSLVTLRALDTRSIPIAERVAQWTIENMQDRRGFFYYRKYSMITNKAPMLHWAQATMFLALALLDAHQTERERDSVQRLQAPNVISVQL